jgi:signal transduction histidine kinase/CheY-like chemotaxis protein
LNVQRPVQETEVLTRGVWLFLLVVAAFMAAARSAHYLLFHTVAELIAVAVGISIFSLAWASRQHLKNGYLVVVGAAYMTIAAVDILHTLTFKGMALLPGVTTNHPTQFWLAARFLEAVALAVAPLFVRRTPSFGLATLAFAVPGALACAAVLLGILPATHVEGLGLTPFKIWSEYLIILVLLAGLALLWHRREDFAADVFALLAGSLVLAVATEACFTHYVGFYDFVNELGHYFRFLSVVLAYLALVVTGVRRPADILYRQLIEKDAELEGLVAERTRELSVAKEAAEAASRAKTTFLANMSHELRTPLNAIMGLTDLALRRAGDAAQIDQLNKVRRASRNLLGIIDDILDLSRIEARQTTLRKVDFRLCSVMADLLNLTGGKAAEKGLALIADLSPRLAAMPVQGDALRLGQILLNLTSNAIKFTDRGSVTVRIAAVTESGADVQLRFEVRDTGIGIAEEDRQRLFDSFEQADGSMTRRHGGTGLGLAICKRLVDLMGGCIGVDSEPGVGSTFWFTLRLDRSANSAAAVEGPNLAGCELRRQGAGSRVLLAEDEPVNQEVARGLLESAGLRVDIANDGAEAVAMAMARRNDYDLVLMDMQMPKLNGLDATRAIRALAGWETRPIVAMTANAFDEDREACLAAGMNDYLAKPVEPETLYETLMKWLPPRPPAAQEPVAPPSAGKDEPSDEAWPVRLAAVPGLDTAQGLQSVRGKWASYARLLGKYADSHDEDAHLIRRELAAGKSAEARRIAHSLKGASGTLGIVGVQRAAAAVEAAVRAQEAPAELDSRLAELEAALAPVLAALRSSLGGDDSGRR